MELLGPFSEEASPPDPGAAAGEAVTLTFFPESLEVSGDLDAARLESIREQVLAALAPVVPVSALLRVQICDVSRDWQESWRDFFHPVVVGALSIRPPWERACVPRLIDVVINPGLGFGTGLHPTTRGMLQLLQRGVEATFGFGEDAAAVVDTALEAGGSLVDAGTGSGVLAIAAAKLGWAPIIAFDNDPVALQAAAENVQNNAVDGSIQVLEADVADAPLEWFDRATVLANLTLDPVMGLVGRLAVKSTDVAASGPADGALTAGPGEAPPGRASGMRTDRLRGAGTSTAGVRPVRLVVSGILAGEQEGVLLRAAEEAGFAVGGRIYEREWVSMELLPMTRAGR